jgi:transcriptional regulator with XRE-family HTH domain
MGIGDLLRREREKKGLSLGDVENATKIRVKYIQALETEQFQIIPGEVYRLGFLKNYARLLDLDPDTIVTRYKSANKSVDHGASHEEEQTGTRQTVANARRSVRDADQPGTRQADADARRHVIDWAGKIAQAGTIFKNRRLLLGAASAVVVLLLAYAVLNIAVSRHNNVPPLQQTQKQTQKLPAVPPTVNTQPQTLEIRLVGTGHCWAEVKVDGQEAYMGTIKPGDTETFTAQSTVWMDLGYPKSVDVYYNGAKLPPLGTTHTVTQTFTKNMGV